MHWHSPRDRRSRVRSIPSFSLFILIALGALTACGGGGGGGSSGSSSGSADGGAGDPGEGGERAAIVQASSLPPKFGSWERKMTQYGREWGEALQNETDFGTQLDLQYYDAQRVHEQIAHYLGETQPWHDYAEAASDIYKSYLESADFRAAGYMRFPHGLYIDWARNGDDESRDYLAKLRDEPPFSYPSSSGGNWQAQKYSREIAYSLETQVLADRAGYPRKDSRIAGLADLALGHVEIWVTGNYVDSDPAWQFCQAFMGGLTGSALIAHYERSVEVGAPDDRVRPALEKLGDFLWNTMWVANVDGTGYGAFEYVQPARSTVGSNAPAPDLNMLIAPMYGWLFYRTGDPKWLERGDAIFAGGVQLADLGSGKRFNQSYRASFQYIDWRTRGVERHGS